MADANRWYSDFGADSTVTARSFRDLRCDTETRVEDTTFARITGTVADGDFRKQLELSVPLYELGEWQYEFQMSSFTTTILNFARRRSRAKGQDSKCSDVHWTWVGRFECRQAVS